MTRCDNCRKMFTEEPRQQPEPKWTTEPPTESGVYWACDPGSASSVKNLSSVRVTAFPLSGCVSVHEAIAGELPVGYFTHWMRIDTPDLPEFKGGGR